MKKPFLRTFRTDTHSFVDPETGEVLNSEVKKYKSVVNDKDSFYLTYSKFLHIISNKDFGGGADIKVYAYLLLNYNSNTTIGINSGVKEDIKNHTSLSVASIEQAIKRLTESVDGNSPLLIKISRGTYQINPQYAFKGSSNDRNEVLKITIMNNPDSFNSSHI